MERPSIVNPEKVARRSFLGLASAAGLVACASPGATPASPTSGPKLAAAAGTIPDKWTAFREEFSLSKDKIHMGGLLLASNPRRVKEAIDRHQKALDEDPVSTVEHDLMTGEWTKATIASAARYFGTAPENVTLTDSTTSGLAVVYGGMIFRPNDEIITTKHDHWVTHEGLRLAAERSGAKVRQIPLYTKGSEAKDETMVRAIESAITPATRLVAITYVHSSTGVKTPVKKIADVIAKANQGRSGEQRILLSVDGVHGFGIENVTMADLGCDFFIAGCHKWMFGPRGTGVVYAKADAYVRLRPTACPFDFPYVMALIMGKPLPPLNGGSITPGGFRAFEHRWALREAFELHLSLGKADVEKRIHELATQTKQGLAKMSHVTLHTPLSAELSSGIVCFEVANMKPDDVIKRLMEKKIIATTTPYDPSYARLTPGLTNTPEEVERTLAAISSLKS